MGVLNMLGMGATCLSVHLCCCALYLLHTLFKVLIDVKKTSYVAVLHVKLAASIKCGGVFRSAHVHISQTFIQFCLGFMNSTEMNTSFALMCSKNDYY